MGGGNNTPVGDPGVWGARGHETRLRGCGGGGGHCRFYRIFIRGRGDREAGIGEGEKTIELFLEGGGEGKVARGVGVAGAQIEALRGRAVGVVGEEREVGVALGFEQLPGGGQELAQGVYGEEEVGAAQVWQLGGQLFAGLLEPGADSTLGNLQLDGDGRGVLAVAVERPGLVAKIDGTAIALLRIFVRWRRGVPGGTGAEGGVSGGGGHGGAEGLRGGEHGNILLVGWDRPARRLALRRGGTRGARNAAGAAPSRGCEGSGAVFGLTVLDSLA